MSAVWVHTWLRKWRSCEMMIIVEFLLFNIFSNHRIVFISRLFVGSSNSKISGSAKSACASKTRSFHPGATSLIRPSCCSFGIPTPDKSSPALASDVYPSYSAKTPSNSAAFI